MGKEEGTDPWFVGIVSVLFTCLIGYPIYRGIQKHKALVFRLLVKYVLKPCCWCCCRPPAPEKKSAKVLVGRDRYAAEDNAVSRTRPARLAQAAGGATSDFLKKRKALLDALDASRGYKRRAFGEEAAGAPSSKFFRSKAAERSHRLSEGRSGDHGRAHTTTDFMRAHDARYGSSVCTHCTASYYCLH